MGGWLVVVVGLGVAGRMVGGRREGRADGVRYADEDAMCS